MKARFVSLLILGAFVGLASVSCGRGQSPAQPSAATAAADAASAGEENASVGYGDEGDVSASSLAVAPFTFTDACVDGKGIAVRFWEAQGKQLTGRFTRIMKMRSGGRLAARLLCTRGRNNCIGAESSPGGERTWGVGLDGDGRTSLAFCKACSTTPQNIRFVCKAGSGFTGQGSIEEGN